MEQKRRKPRVKIILPEKKGYKQWVKYLPLALAFIVILIVFSMRGRGEKSDEKRFLLFRRKMLLPLMRKMFRSIERNS